MINIIKSDLYRMFKGKLIYIAIIVLIGVCLFNVTNMALKNIIEPTFYYLDSSDIYTHSYNGIFVSPEVGDELENANNFIQIRKIIKEKVTFPLDKKLLEENYYLSFFFIIIISIIIAADFSNKTIKNTLSYSITRKKYYFSKFILVFGMCTVLILFNNYFTYFANLIINGKNLSSSIIEILKTTLIQLPLLYGMISLFICLLFILKKKSLFNVISIPFVLLIRHFFREIIYLIDSIVYDICEKNCWIYKWDIIIMDFYEIQMALQFLTENPTKHYIANCAILGTVYFLIFNLIGYKLFKKLEID